MNKRNLERAFYGLVIVLSLVALALVACSQALSTDTRVVYKGF